MPDNTTLQAGSGGDTIATDDIGGVKFQRNKLIFGADGVNAGDVAVGNPLPVHVRNDSRTFMQFSAVAASAGSSGTETMISMDRSASPGGSVTSGSSWTPSAGKRFRITSITFAARGNNTATAQATVFRLKANTAGAATTAAPAMLAARVATPATANAWDRVSFAFGDEGPEIVGDGTLQFGVSATATYTTNAPTLDVLITGYEF